MFHPRYPAPRGRININPRIHSQYGRRLFAYCFLPPPKLERRHRGSNTCQTCDLYHIHNLSIGKRCTRRNVLSQVSMISAVPGPG